MFNRIRYWWAYSDKDGLKFLLFMIVLIGGLGYLCVLFTEAQCRAHTETTGQPAKRVLLTCYVKEDGRWMHWDEYKLRYATKGAKE